MRSAPETVQLVWTQRTCASLGTPFLVLLPLLTSWWLASHGGSDTPPCFALLPNCSFGSHSSACPPVTGAALELLCLALSAGVPPSPQPAVGRCDSCPGEGLASIKRAVAVTTCSKFECGDPQNLWVRFPSEQGNSHANSGSITDSGARLGVLMLLGS